MLREDCTIDEESFSFLSGNGILRPVVRKQRGEILLSDPAEGYIALYRIESRCFFKKIDKELYDHIFELCNDSTIPLEQVLACLDTEQCLKWSE